LGSLLATCIAEFNPWRRGSITASSTLGLRTHLGWSPLLGWLKERC
jgi:hypothetical protein